MSKHKPTATAVIRFFPDKTVTVELDSLVGVSPRRLERAGHLLNREYRGKRARHNAKRHRMAREAAVEAETKAVEDNAAFHEAEDKRLAEAAEKDEKAGRKALLDATKPKAEPKKTEEKPATKKKVAEKKAKKKVAKK